MVIRRVIAVLAAPFGLVIGVATLLVVVAVTANRPLAIASGAVVLTAAAAALGWWGLRGVRARVGLTIGAAGAALVLLTVLLGAVVYAPAAPTTPYPAVSTIQYIDLPTGSRIAYTKTSATGEPHAAPVILVHGGPGAPDQPVPEPAAALAGAGFDVYAYHQAGSGQSGRLADPTHYTVARHLADLDAFRAALGADRVILVGASWGGQLIANYLALHAARVEKAVVVSPGPIWSPTYDDAERLTAAGRRDQEDVVAQRPRFLLAHLLMNVVGPRGAQALLPDSTMDGEFEAIVNQIDMRPGCRTDPIPRDRPPAVGLGFWANAATSLDSQRVADPRPLLREVPTPVLVLRGECDYLAWPVAREYRDLLPNATLMAVDGAGHALAADQPELFQQATLAYLRDEPLPRPPYQGHDPPW